MALKEKLAQLRYELEEFENGPVRRLAGGAAIVDLHQRVGRISGTLMRLLRDLEEVALGDESPPPAADRFDLDGSRKAAERVMDPTYQRASHRVFPALREALEDGRGTVVNDRWRVVVDKDDLGDLIAEYDALRAILSRYRDSAQEFVDVVKRMPA